MASHYEAPIRRPLVTGEKSYHDVTVDVAAPVEGKANKAVVDCLFNRTCRISLGNWMYDIYYIYRYWNLGFK